MGKEKFCPGYLSRAYFLPFASAFKPSTAESENEIFQYAKPWTMDILAQDISDATIDDLFVVS